MAREAGIAIPAAPKFTAITSSLVGSEAPYRFFSGMAHGLSWATLNAGFERLPVTNDGRIPIQPGISSDMGQALLSDGLRYFDRAATLFASHLGWEAGAIEDALQTAIDCLSRTPTWL